jgi:hypothetical protein
MQGVSLSLKKAGRDCINCFAEVVAFALHIFESYRQTFQKDSERFRQDSGLPEVDMRTVRW